MADELNDLVLHMFDVIHQLWELAKSRLTNIEVAFTNLTLQQWIRLVAIVGAYMLLRPYVLKHAAKSQEKLMEKQAKEDEEQEKAKISANALRGQIDIPEDSDDDEEGGEQQQTATGSDWGKKARRRQRQVIKKLLDAEEKRLQETMDEQADKDIEEFLTG